MGVSLGEALLARSQETAQETIWTMIYSAFALLYLAVLHALASATLQHRPRHVLKCGPFYKALIAASGAIVLAFSVCMAFAGDTKQQQANDSSAFVEQ